MSQGAPTPPPSFASARLPPPHFAGRKDELALLNQGLERLLQTADPAGGIVLITGLPGAGKTQLARKFAEDAGEQHRGVASCFVGTSVLESPVDLLLDMTRQLCATDAARQAADVDTRRTGSGEPSAGEREGLALRMNGITRAFQRSRTVEHVRHTSSLDGSD